MIQRLRWLLAALASLRITVAGLALLLMLTIAGTLYQAGHGLFQAQQRYFSSWYFFAGGWLPVPGAQSVMLALFANLGASILHLGLARRLRLGFVATHAGLALLLAAGGMTFYFGRYGDLPLVEGERANVAVARHDWELAVMPAAGERRVVHAIDLRRLRPGRAYPLPLDGFSIRIVRCMPNATREAGMIRIGAPAADPQDNRPALVAMLEQPGQPATPLELWGGDAAPTPLPGDATRHVIGLRLARMPLPASIRLLEFRRTVHPGSDVARSYSSLVELDAGTAAERQVTISMNRPLRLGGFTFYQSAFGAAPGGGDTSTLAVVRSRGRTMPYLATALTAAGLLLHFLGQLRLRVRTAAREVAR